MYDLEKKNKDLEFSLYFFLCNPFKTGLDSSEIEFAFQNSEFFDGKIDIFA